VSQIRWTWPSLRKCSGGLFANCNHHLARNMKLYPLVLAFAGAGLAGVNAIPFRVTIVSSSNQIGPAGKYFDNTPAPPVRGEDGLYRIQVVPPTEARRRPCHSGIDISNRFRKLFGFEEIEAHPPVGNIATMPLPPIPNDGGVHIMPVDTPLENTKNVGAPPVHRHSHHRHHHLKDAPFMERLSHALMILGPWEGRIVAFVFGGGIGVILRMIYVLMVVTYRMFRGPAQPGEDDADEEETTVLLVAAPPEYSRDEKVAS
jgi:hypothetical protein